MFKVVLMSPPKKAVCIIMCYVLVILYIPYKYVSVLYSRLWKFLYFSHLHTHSLAVPGSTTMATGTGQRSSRYPVLIL